MSIPTQSPDSSRRRLLMLPLGLAALAGTTALGTAAFSTPAQAASDQQETVDRARLTAEDLRKDGAFGTALSLIKRSRGVLIVPRIFKAGFFVGGAGGQGVLLTRNGAAWSNPAFYTIASASFGLQIGAQESEMVLIIMSQKALNAVMRNQFKIGAEAGLAVATLGSSAEAATTTNLNADIIAWASSTGAFAGVSLDGTLIKPNPGDDRSYYGRSLTSSDIVLRHQGANPGAAALRQSLATLG